MTEQKVPVDILANDLRLADKYLQNVLMYEEGLEYGSVRSLGDARRAMARAVEALGRAKESGLDSL